MDVYRGELSLKLLRKEVSVNEYTREALRVYWLLMEYLDRAPRYSVSRDHLEKIHELAPFLFSAYINGESSLPQEVYSKYRRLIEEMERLGMIKIEKRRSKIVLYFYVSPVDPSDERVRLVWRKNYPTFFSGVEQQVKLTLESIL